MRSSVLTPFSGVILGCCLGVVTCDSDGSGIWEPVVPPIPLSELQSAPELIQIDSLSLKLETYLWRDFMPIAPPDGQPLVAIIRVIEQGGKPIPPGLDAHYLWVIHGALVWATRLTADPGSPSPPHVLERFARNGPKWGPKIYVDVVVGLRDEPSGELRLLQAKGQWIARTD